jgi:hypothetical protein
MIINTPPIECYVKKSHISGEPKFSKEDEMVFGVLFAIRFVRNRAPLYIVYLPSVGAIYDKVNQNAIFDRPILDFEEDIILPDVAWWDSMSSNWQLIELRYLKNTEIEMVTRTGKTRKGLYLFTCDPMEPEEGTDYGESEIWHEHKTKTYFFDKETGVLCCTPNNKMRVWSSSLSGNKKEDPSFLKVYKETPNQMSHENDTYLGDSDKYIY